MKNLKQPSEFTSELKYSNYLVNVINENNELSDKAKTQFTLLQINPFFNCPAWA